jgi:ABC-type Fe3+-hydroxamate transport system substrate-binding protein
MEDLEYMGFPVVGTYDTRINNTENRLALINFIGSLFGARDKAEAHTKHIRATIEEIRRKTAGFTKPTISWGIYDNGHVFGLRADFWLAELMVDAGGDYLMGEVVSDTTEISLELFITRSKDADIFFANPYLESVVKSKRDMLRAHPDLELFKAFSPLGKVVTTEELTWQDTGNLHKIALDMAHILHPELYPERALSYFNLLPN